MSQFYTDGVWQRRFYVGQKIYVIPAYTEQTLEKAYRVNTDLSTWWKTSAWIGIGKRMADRQVALEKELKQAKATIMQLGLEVERLEKSRRRMGASIRGYQERGGRDTI